MMRKIKVRSIATQPMPTAMLTATMDPEQCAAELRRLAAEHGMDTVLRCGDLVFAGDGTALVLIETTFAGLNDERDGAGVYDGTCIRFLPAWHEIAEFQTVPDARGGCEIGYLSADGEVETESVVVAGEDAVSVERLARRCPRCRTFFDNLVEVTRGWSPGPSLMCEDCLRENTSWERG